MHYSVFSLSSLAQGGTCVRMNNFYDAQYTTKVLIGTPRQVLNSVPDTGSFDLVVASVRCKDRSCLQHTLFDPNQSTSFVEAAKPHDVSMAYGQGEVLATLANETVSFGAHWRHDNTSILIMHKQTLANFDAASYDAVMGLGKSATSGTGHSAFLSNLDVSTFGVCLGQASGANGRLDLSQDIEGLQGSYKELTVIGDMHWGLELKKISVGTRQLNITAHSHSGANYSFPACDGVGCAAILDSGTSLLTLPTEYLDALFEAINVTTLLKLQEQSNCSGIEALPSLMFELGGRRSARRAPPFGCRPMAAAEAAAVRGVRARPEGSVGEPTRPATHATRRDAPQ